ncbi:tyrosine-protein kinase receptor Tie-1-like, partial [Asterias rubens]|uniref:tyrosine-protein kinase receptor Tie-1-like n=1 Tax=Asterias rubens TaxID=7604 RepID=UPI00145562C1
RKIPRSVRKCEDDCTNYNEIWLAEHCFSADCQASCDNLTLESDTGIIAGPPLLHDVKTVSGGSLVLSWESGNCTTSVKCNSTVSIVRHSSDLIEWFYQIVTNGDSKFLIDVEQDACVKYVEVILVDEFGVSPPSDLKTVGSFRAFLNDSLIVKVTPETVGSIKMDLTWELRSGFYSYDMVYFLDMLSDSCQDELPNTTELPPGIQEGNVTKLSTRIRRNLSHEKCIVNYKLYGTFGNCYRIRPVHFQYVYGCKDITAGCQISYDTPRFNHSSVRIRVFPANMTALVEWTPEMQYQQDINGYCLQWGQLKMKDPSTVLVGLMGGIQESTAKEITVPGVESNSVWIEGLEANTHYGVRTLFDINGTEAEFKMVRVTAFNTTVPTLASPLVIHSTVAPTEDSTNLIVAGLTTLTLLVIASVVAVLVLRKCRRERKGNCKSKTRMRRDEESMPNIYSITPVESPEPPIPDRWEIPYDRIEFGEILGKGQFGIVLKAITSGKLSTYHTSGSSLFRDSLKSCDVEVAVKMIHDTADESQKKEFRREMKLMKDIGHHSNLVSLLGCCSLDTTPLCLVVEHCCHGDLLRFLRANRDIVAYAETTGSQPDTIESLTPSDLISFARQIARGMEFLSQKGFVHRDLAARNIMVANDKTVKIGDFGLTRYVYDDHIYVHRRGGKLPIKWMSVEALYDQVFTTFNDVWAFGVVLFELITFGASPYPGVHNKEIPPMLKKGYRMHKPDNCSEILYAIMCACWHPCPDERPTFTQLRDKLEALLEEDTPYLSFSPNYSSFPFMEISEESDDEEERDVDQSEESGIRSEETIAMTIMDGGDSIVKMGSDDVFVETEVSQPMLDSGSSSWKNKKHHLGGELQKRDSGLGSDYVYSSGRTTLEDIPLI